MTGIYAVVDAAFSALAAKFERDAILAKIKDEESKGATAEQIAESITRMRDEAITNAQDAINKA